MTVALLKQKFIDYITDKEELSDDVTDKINEFITSVIQSDISENDKFDLIGRAVYETERINNFATSYVFNLIEKQVQYNPKDQYSLMLIAKQLDTKAKYIDKKLAGKIANNIYQHLNKENRAEFDYKYGKTITPLIKEYKKEFKKQKNEAFIIETKQRLKQIDQDLINSSIDAKQKFKLIDEAISIAKENLFGKKQANLMKVKYCEFATTLYSYIYPEPEPHDYKQMAINFRKQAALADYFGKKSGGNNL